MKRLTIIAAFSLCLLLIFFSQSAVGAAQVALSIWWNTLLPVLFPFFVCVSLIEQLGILNALAKALYPISKKLKISHYTLPLLLFGGISGYPSGARLCGTLQENGSISGDEGDRLCAICNLASPMFLVGTIAGGLFFDTRLIWPLLAGHFGGALLLFLLITILFPIKNNTPPSIIKKPAIPFSRLLPNTISVGIRDLIRIGGTVVFFMVLGELLMQTGIIQLIGLPIDRLIPTLNSDVNISSGILLGLIEMTGGCYLLLQSNLPVNITAPACAFIISFGGLSIFIQSMTFVELRKPFKYILLKLIHGMFAAVITWLVLDNSIGTVEVFAPVSSSYTLNALSGITILFSCSLGIAIAFLLALIFGDNSVRH